jgi:RecB family endonuclease NucS
MNDEANWESLFARFDYEHALSGYIATYPHHLEDGLTVHPTLKVRELTFQDSTRSDVVLLDRNLQTVIVECKQGQPNVANINQLRRYLAHLKKEKGVTARGILVHGGSKKLHEDVVAAAQAVPKIEVVQHRLAVDFARCN